MKAATNVTIPTVVESTDKLLTQFWGGEQPTIEETALTPEEDIVQEHYNTHHAFLPNAGRYEVTLPRKPNTPSLGESRTQALQRYLSNEKSLMRKGNWHAFQKVTQE